ncbi:hypothetical protein PHMEG_00014346 [Phytophthora megakarya]|uniref:PX domain-containing protein n=1 Tax=Phytophthora megakarya TaxID=4795 RepID=A0A225W4I6_9STRA|nr:hypothetical protein PHMEG_00014346 [Phytophthora megakarya]
MNSLSASIISALALKPSTVYILKVENSRTRKSWHIRRCFSEFCELREKLLALIDDQMAAYLTSSEMDIETSTKKLAHSISCSTASSSASTCSSINSYRGKARNQLSPTSERFAYVFKQFPPRKLFGSRSKRVIEARSMALNRFLQQALEVVEVVRQRQLIAICFSMMTHIESFLDCRAHREVARVAPASSVNRSERQPDMSPHAARRASAAVSLTPGFHHYPLVPTPAFTMTFIDHKYQSSSSRYSLSSSDEEADSDDDTQRFNNFDFTQRFYREFGRQEERAEIYDEDSDDEEMQMLKKTWSAMLESELRERKLHHSGSHFSMLESGHSPAETWARRVEIAGIHSAVRLKPEVNTKVSRPASHNTEQLLHRHRSSYRQPVQHYPTSA